MRIVTILTGSSWIWIASPGSWSIIHPDETVDDNSLIALLRCDLGYADNMDEPAESISQMFYDARSCRPAGAEYTARCDVVAVDEDGDRNRRTRIVNIVPA